MASESVSPSGDITILLNDWRAGDQKALDSLISLIYGELRRLAASHLKRERADHTLQATALVHEAFLRLGGQRQFDWRNRAHFFAIAATMMRRILVDHARGREAAKRGGSGEISLQGCADIAIDGRPPELVALDGALDALAKIDPEQVRLVELRYFGGLTTEETALVLGVSSRTVKRRWQTAKLWLYDFLRER